MLQACRALRQLAQGTPGSRRDRRQWAKEGGSTSPREVGRSGEKDRDFRCMQVMFYRHVAKDSKGIVKAVPAECGK